MEKLINPWENYKGYNCFGCAPQNPFGLHMDFYEDGDEVVSFWKPKAEFQGWIETLHGGIQATLLDEICAWVVFRKCQTTGMTSKMETRYKHPVLTTAEQITIRARVVEKRRNLVLVEAKIINDENVVCTEAVCTYFTFTTEKAKNDMAFKGCFLENEKQVPE